MDGVLDGCRVETCDSFSTFALKYLYDYWTDLQKTCGRQHIRWSDIDLMDLYKIASNLMVKDIIDDGAEFRNRYWGTRLCDFYGVDATGALIGDYFEEPYRVQTLSVLRFVMKDNLAVRIAGTSKFFYKREHLSVEACYIPLFDDTDKPEKIIISYDFVSLD